MGIHKIFSKIKNGDAFSRSANKFYKNVNKNAKHMKHNSEGFRLFDYIDRADGKDLIEKTLGIRMTKPVKYMAIGSIVGYMGYNTVKDQVHKAQLGEINANRNANMVNLSVSPGIDSVAKRLEEETNPYFQEKLAKKSVSKTQSGVSPEIVFAMHELRSGE